MTVIHVNCRTKPVLCAFGCEDEPVGIYYFDQGCVCFREPKQVQALCEHHVYEATPIHDMKYVCSVERWNYGRPER